MEVFYHHLYEYEKGLRNLILHTADINDKNVIEFKLKNRNIPYLIYEIKNNKINVFFGNENCIKVIENINKINLSDYSDEEDFILGIMLGYDRIKQCERYINRKTKKENIEVLIG